MKKKKKKGMRRKDFGMPCIVLRIDKRFEKEQKEEGRRRERKKSWCKAGKSRKNSGPDVIKSKFVRLSPLCHQKKI